jgi:hypothetical protein
MIYPQAAKLLESNPSPRIGMCTVSYMFQAMAAGLRAIDRETNSVLNVKTNLTFQASRSKRLIADGVYHLRVSL